MSLRHALELRDVHFRWPGQAVFSLSIPALSIAAGESVLLLGGSGSGKSTLLSLICGTVDPASGEIWLSDTELSALPARRKDRFRAEEIGMIFQQFNLLPFGTVRDNILLPLRFAPKRRARITDERAEALALTQSLGLPDLLNAKARTLSVGQQQRVAVARALIGRPPLIIADEPTSALDEGSQAAFLDLLFDQARAHGTTLLMVSHDPRLGARFDRVLKMEDIAQTQRVAA